MIVLIGGVKKSLQISAGKLLCSFFKVMPQDKDSAGKLECVDKRKAESSDKYLKLVKLENMM